MIDRRAAIRAAVGGAAGRLAGAVVAGAAQDFQKFVPFLVDLPGWTGNKADGMAMQMPGASMITATREYKRGSATLDAQVISGVAAQGVLAAIQSGMKVETADMRMSTVAGRRAHRRADIPVPRKTPARSSSRWGPDAVFNLAFTGVPEDEAYSLWRSRFDWKAIQAALPK